MEADGVGRGRRKGAGGTEGGNRDTCANNGRVIMYPCSSSLPLPHEPILTFCVHSPDVARLVEELIERPPSLSLNGSGLIINENMTALGTKNIIHPFDAPISFLHAIWSSIQQTLIRAGLGQSQQKAVVGALVREVRLQISLNTLAPSFYLISQLIGTVCDL